MEIVRTDMSLTFQLIKVLLHFPGNEATQWIYNINLCIKVCAKHLIFGVVRDTLPISCVDFDLD